jgi:hypothetical protein
MPSGVLEVEVMAIWTFDDFRVLNAHLGRFEVPLVELILVGEVHPEMIKSTALIREPVSCGRDLVFAQAQQKVV